MTIRTYKTADRNFIVRGVTPERVIYDVVFTQNDARDVQTLKDEFPDLPLDTQRNPQRFLSQPTDLFALRLAMAGHYLRADTVEARKSIYATLSNTGYRL